jgi:hypothetical protein
VCGNGILKNRIILLEGHSSLANNKNNTKKEMNKQEKGKGKRNLISVK